MFKHTTISANSRTGRSNRTELKLDLIPVLLTYMSHLLNQQQTASGILDLLSDKGGHRADSHVPHSSQAMTSRLSGSGTS